MKGLFGFGKKDAKPEVKTSATRKYLVQYDKKGCIGAGTCEAVDPKHWKLKENRKADLLGSKENNGIFEVEIGDDELVNMKSAADGCPKNVIHIRNIETGEKII